MLKSVRMGGGALALESLKEPEKGAQKRGVDGVGLERGAGGGVERERCYTVQG